jgi:hypothetical protein
MSESPVRPRVLALPLDVADALAALAGEGDEAVENLVVALLTEVVRLGRPGALHAAARLAAEVADTLADRWQLRRAELARLRADVQRLDKALGQLAQGA